jgi:hypothetical protein
LFINYSSRRDNLFAISRRICFVSSYAAIKTSSSAFLPVNSAGACLKLGPQRLHFCRATQFEVVSADSIFQPIHLPVIFGIALLVFGPKKLPELEQRTRRRHSRLQGSNGSTGGREAVRYSRQRWRQ